MKTHKEEYLNQRAKYTVTHLWELKHGYNNTYGNTSDNDDGNSNGNDNYNDNYGNNSSSSSVVFVLPDIEQELEKEVRATAAEEPWLVVHIGTYVFFFFV